MIQSIFARKAVIIKKKYKDNKVIRALRLYGGYTFLRDPDRDRFQKIDFSNGSFDLHLSNAEKIREREYETSARGLSNDELIKRYELSRKTKAPRHEALAYLVEWHRRAALPFASLIFVLLGFPLAIVNRGSGKGFGLGLSVIFIFLYFAIFLSGETMAIKWHFLPPAIYAWLADLIFIFFTVYFYRKRLSG